jgi:macrolide transport system ATP-binding/permease protein
MSYEILRLSSLTKSYSIKQVLNGIDLILSEGEHIALVGENGIGKTTLARIITGHEQADSGTLRLKEGAEIGYLPQEVSGDEQTTVHRYIEQATGALATLRDQMQQLEQRMTEALPDEVMAEVLEQYGTLQEAFERRGGYDIDARIRQIFSGLGIDYIAPERLLGTLSGGERTRVALTALLLREPDLLVLDEPTNHLDFAGIEWLEKYLAQYPHALLLITHDRTFINRVANVICELHARTRTLHTYHGNYDDYLMQRGREYADQVSAYNDQQNEIRSMQRAVKQLTNNRKVVGVFTFSGDKFLKNFKRERGESLVSKMVRDTRHQLDEALENKMDNPRHEWHIDFRFDPEPLVSAEPVRFDSVRKSFAADPLFDRLDAVVPRGERVVLVAPNGTGKTTLLRMIIGIEQPDHGAIRISPSAKLGYLDQDGETMDGEKTVLETYREYLHGSDSELLAELHRSGLFSDATLGEKRVRDLSVGQRRKLGLACLVASRANVLLLDEPTNHLDPLSLEALEDALLHFPGTILAVSHDRRFVEKVASRIWRIEHGQLIEEIVSEVLE